MVPEDHSLGLVPLWDHSLPFSKALDFLFQTWFLYQDLESDVGAIKGPTTLLMLPITELLLLHPASRPPSHLSPCTQDGFTFAIPHSPFVINLPVPPKALWDP